MATDWEKLQQQTAYFRNYLTTLAAPSEKKGSSFVLTRTEIERLLGQNGENSKPDGLRIYLGGEPDDNGNMLPTIQVLACESNEQGIYQDFNLPEKFPEAGSAEFINLPLLAKLYPCPPHCSKPNFLNNAADGDTV